MTGAATGRVTAKTSDTSAFLTAFGQSGISLPQGLGQAMVVGADATYTTDGRLALRDMTLDLDGNKLEGGADITLAQVPEFTAQLNGGHLRVPGLTSAVGENGAAARGGRLGLVKGSY